MKSQGTLSALLIGALIAMFVANVQAAETCTVTNYTISDNGASVTLAGTLTGGSGVTSKSWLVLNRTDNSESVKTRVAIALAAKVADKNLIIHVPDPYTCATVPAQTYDV